MNTAAAQIQAAPNQQQNIKIAVVIFALVLINIVLMQTVGATGPATFSQSSVGQSISNMCTSIVKPILWGLAALVAIIGVGRGIIKMQNEENGGATIMMAFIGAILIGSLPAAAAALVPAATIGVTGVFCA